MKKQTKDLEQIAQQDVDCIMLTGKNVKHVTKSEILEAALKVQGRSHRSSQKNTKNPSAKFSSLTKSCRSPKKTSAAKTLPKYLPKSLTTLSQT